MKLSRLSRFLLVLLAVIATTGMVLASGPSVGGAAADAGAAHQVDQLLPMHLGWVRVVLLAIMWWFIAAILLGPVVMRFTPPVPAEPVSHDHGDAHAAVHGGSTQH